MYVLKRIAACVLDYALLLIPAAVGLMKLSDPMTPGAPHDGFGLYSRGILMGELLAPALILGVMTGLTGLTPGKLIFFLRVRDYSGEPPGVAHGILRELAKVLLFATVYGLFYTLASVLKDRDALYDSWLGLEVEDLRPYDRLTQSRE